MTIGGNLKWMRPLACLLVLAIGAGALPPVSPGFARLRDLRQEIQQSLAETLKREAFEAKPREERMLLTFGKGEDFEGKELKGKVVVETCLVWEEAAQDTPTPAGLRVLALLPEILREKYGGPGDAKERRSVGYELIDGLDSDFLPVREASIASLRRIYPPPRDDSYDPKKDRRDRAAAIRVWRRHIRRR